MFASPPRSNTRLYQGVWKAAAAGKRGTTNRVCYLRRRSAAARSATSGQQRRSYQRILSSERFGAPFGERAVSSRFGEACGQRVTTLTPRADRCSQDDIKGLNADIRATARTPSAWRRASGQYVITTDPRRQTPQSAAGRQSTFGTRIRFCNFVNFLIGRNGFLEAYLGRAAQHQRNGTGARHFSVNAVNVKGNGPSACTLCGMFSTPLRNTTSADPSLGAMPARQTLCGEEGFGKFGSLTRFLALLRIARYGRAATTPCLAPAPDVA